MYYKDYSIGGELYHSGVSGMKWYHRYHQSYSTVPTRSGKVGEEHFTKKETKTNNKEGLQYKTILGSQEYKESYNKRKAFNKTSNKKGLIHYSVIKNGKVDRVVAEDKATGKIVMTISGEDYKKGYEYEVAMYKENKKK